MRKKKGTLGPGEKSIFALYLPVGGEGGPKPSGGVCSQLGGNNVEGVAF